MTQPLGDGWVDPRHATRYFGALADRYGSVDDFSSFARLFMIPGKGHGTGFGTYGPTADALEQLVTWVEHGHAPECLIIDYEPRGDRPEVTRTVFPHPAEAMRTDPPPRT
jgi:hypothetical protein